MTELEKSIQELGKQVSEKSFKEFKTLQKAYFTLTDDLLNTSFSSQWEQTEVIRKLSQLGLALYAKGQEYKAFNIVQCN